MIERKTFGYYDIDHLPRKGMFYLPALIEAIDHAKSTKEAILQHEQSGWEIVNQSTTMYDEHLPVLVIVMERNISE